MASQLERAANLFPLNREIRMGPGYFYSRFRDERISAQSIQAIETTIKTNPYSPDLWFNLAAIKHFSGDLAGSATALAKAKEYAPKSAFLHEIQ